LKIYSDLDIVRASIASSAITTEGVKPTHFLRLEALTKIFGLDGDLLDALNVLKNIHEIEHAGNGYWVPCPSRNVRIGNHWMLISTMSTEQIASIVPLLAIDSVARVSTNFVDEFPRQELRDWIGSTDLKSWLLDEIELVKQRVSRTPLDPVKLEYYRPRCTVGANKKYKNWFSYADLIGDIENEVLLVRHDRNYHWCLFDRNILLESTIQVTDYNYLIRAQLAIEMINGIPPRVIKTFKDKETITIKQTFPFPKEEESLLSALSNKKLIDGVALYQLPTIFNDVVFEIFLNIHIKFE
jgi:hypothetical protein